MTDFLKRSGETVFVTGATGYVGSVVVDRLLEHGYEVVGLIRSETDKQALEDKGAKAVVGDVGDTALIAEAVSGASAIVHTAAPNDPTKFESLQAMIAMVAGVLENLTTLARTRNIRLLATSGTSLYGPTGRDPVDETAPLQAMMPGADVLTGLESRLIAEKSAYFIRLAVVYGRKQSGPMNQLIENVRTRGRLPLVDPDNVLSVVEVDDLADLYLSILEAANPPQVVNAVSDILTWAEFITAIGQAVGVQGDFEIVDPQAAMALGGPSIYMPMNMAVSSDLAERELKWKSKRPRFPDQLTGRV